jgi:endonuclease/exonuclease/phosphatase family metal-dependent hydrolase
MKSSLRVSSALISFILLLLLQSQGTAQVKKKLTLKVLCYNIHHALPPSKKDGIDLDAIARVISQCQPDLVALQEVDVHTKRSGAFDQAEELGRKTGLKAYFIKAIDYDGGEYGVAILSRYAMSDLKRYPLPTKEGTGGEPRVLGAATITLPGKREIVFACTHLDAQADSVNRALQINAIAEALKKSTVPVVIAGDFNAHPGSGVIGMLDTYFKRTCDPCDFTIPVDKPKRAIDFIAFSPEKKFTVKKHEVISERYASDHLPVFAELEIGD